MTTSLPGTIADIAIPDTALVRATTEFIRDVEDDLLFDHSRRVYLFGALQGAVAVSTPISNSCTWGPCSTTSD